jgi:hypothetical protein
VRSREEATRVVGRNVENIANIRLTDEQGLALSCSFSAGIWLALSEPEVEPVSNHDRLSKFDVIRV